MIKRLNFLGTPSRDKLNLFISIGTFLFVLGMADVMLNSFFEINITSSLPRWFNYFTPLFLVLLVFIILELNFQETEYWII